MGAHVRQSREQLELSQQDLAVRARVSISTLQKIERAETKDPGFFTVTRLAAEGWRTEWGVSGGRRQGEGGGRSVLSRRREPPG